MEMEVAGVDDHDGDVAALVLSRLLSHDAGTAFVDAATGKRLSFSALRRAALSLASALRLGLGLRRGDAVLVLARNSLLLPQILLGVLAAGAAVATTAAADPTPAEVAAAARDSGAVMLVADPDIAARLRLGPSAAAALLPPLLLTTSDPAAALSAEELIHGGDPAEAAVAGSGSDVAFLAYGGGSPSSATSMTRGDLLAAAEIGGGGRRVCVASSLVPMCSAHGLPLLALGLPAAGATTVLLQSDSDPDATEAVAAHAATDLVVAAPPEALHLLLPLDGKLSTLRRVVVGPTHTPLTAGAREEFRRRLPWVQLLSLSGYGTPENPTPTTEQLSPSSFTPPAPAAAEMMMMIQ